MKIHESNQLNKEEFEARQNLSGFFGLLLEVAIRNNIDIGLYENNRDTNNSN